MQAFLKGVTTLLVPLLLSGSSIADDSEVSRFQIEPVESVLSLEPVVYGNDVEPSVVERVTRLEGELDALALQKSSSRTPRVSACSCKQPMLFATVDWIHWQVRGRERLQTIRNLDFPPSVFTPDIQEPLQFDATSGIRASLGYQFRDGWKLSCIYTHLQPNSKDVFIAGQRDLSLDYDVFDLQLLRSLPLNESLSFSVFGSVRWINLDQKHTQIFQNFQNNVVTSFSTHSLTDKTDAVGLRTGGSATWHCWNHLNLFGSGAFAVLSQRSTRAYSTQSAVDTDSSIDGLPILETAAGIAWDHRKFQIKTGYELATLFNLTDVGIMPFEGIQNQTRTLTFNGVFVELSLTF
jgi:hypothetical protein